MDRPKNGLESVIEIENFRFIKNVCQREGRGGKPALFV